MAGYDVDQHFTPRYNPWDQRICLVPDADLLTAIRAGRAEIVTDTIETFTETGMNRITEMLNEARASGAEIVELEAGAKLDRTTRLMPIALVIGPARNLRVTTEEIFGPILPLVPYNTLEGAIAEVNAGERPLGLYVFGDDTATTDRVLGQITSGGRR